MPAVFMEIIYYIYILLFGVYVSMKIGCGHIGAREKQVFLIACPILLLLQGICLQLSGMERVWMIYPLITHLPMVLGLIFALKVHWERALLSVTISYSMCQLTRWIGLVIDRFTLAGPAALLIHLALSHAVLLLLAKYCLSPVHEVVAAMAHPLPGFGLLPLMYYLFEYFMLFTGRKYSDIPAVSELMPTCLVLFFVVFAIIYRREMEKRRSAEELASALEMQISSAGQEIDALRMIEERTAVHRHDLRHHLMLIDSMLASGKHEQATEYIHEIQRGIDEITPARFCENETANLLLGVFRQKASGQGLDFRVKAALPAQLMLPDTELCVLLSNGIENALEAAAGLEGGVSVFCSVQQSKLLIEIKNPYRGEIIMEKDLPRSKDKGHGYGCRSIQSIVHRRGGVCTFEAEKGIFILRIAIPMQHG